jgi:hypothetical protein
MQASTKRRPGYVSVAPVALAPDDEPSRYWALAIVAGCVASWATIFGAAKLLMVLI